MFELIVAATLTLAGPPDEVVDVRDLHSLFETKEECEQLIEPLYLFLMETAHSYRGREIVQKANLVITCEERK